MRIQATSLATVVVLTCAISAQAGPILTYDFTGTVQTVNETDSFRLNGTIPIGTKVTGSFTYEAGVPGNSIAGFGVDYPDTAVRFSVNIGGGIFVWDSNLPLILPHVFVEDNQIVDGDLFQVIGDEHSPSNLTVPVGATIASPFGIEGFLGLRDPTETAFSSVDIPTNLDLSKFEERLFLISGGLAGPQSMSDIGSILVALDSLTLAPEPSSVPEPSTLLLFGTGVALFGFARGRIRGHSR